MEFEALLVKGGKLAPIPDDGQSAPHINAPHSIYPVWVNLVHFPGPVGHCGTVRGPNDRCWTPLWSGCTLASWRHTMRRVGQLTG